MVRQSHVHIDRRILATKCDEIILFQTIQRLDAQSDFKCAKFGVAKRVYEVEKATRKHDLNVHPCTFERMEETILQNTISIKLRWRKEHQIVRY